MDVSIDFSVEELVELAACLGIQPLPGLGPDPLAEVTADARTMLLDSARRSLAARRVIAFRPDGPPAVVPAVTSLLQVTTSPGILARAVHERGDTVEKRFLAAVPEVSVEHALLPNAVHRLTPFPTEEFLARLLQFTQLEDRPAVDVEAFTITVASLQRCVAHVSAVDTTLAVKSLQEAGAPPNAAEAVVAALSNKIRSASATILRRPDQTHLEGGELAWLDGGEHGLWLMPMLDLDRDSPSSDSALVTIQPTTVPSIAAEMHSYLPPADKESGSARRTASQ